MPKFKSSENQVHLLLALGIALLSFFVNYKYFLGNADLHHDGVMFKPALDIASGATLFRDTFTQYGPLATYIDSIGIWLFGPTVASLRLITNLTYSLIFMLMALGALQLLPDPLALFAVGLQILMLGETNLPWPSVKANLFVVGCFTALAYLLKSSHWRMPLALLAGFSCAMVYWCRQAAGLGFLFGMIALLFLAGFFYKRYFKWPELCAFMGGAALGNLGFVALFKANGSYDSWYQQNVVWPQHWEMVMRGTRTKLELIPYMTQYFFGNYQEIIRPIIPTFIIICVLYWVVSRLLIGKPTPLGIFISVLLWAILSYLRGRYLYTIIGFDQIFAQFVFLSIFPVSAFCLLAALRGKKSPDLLLLAILSCGVGATWLHIYPLGDVAHGTWAICITYLYSIYFLYLLLSKNLTLVFSATFVLFGPLFVQRAGDAIERIQQIRIPSTNNTHSVVYGMLGALPEDDIWKTFRYLESLMANYPDKGIINFTDHALFAAQAKNLKMPDPYFVWWGSFGFDQVMRFSWETRQRFIHDNQPFIISNVDLVAVNKKYIDAEGYFSAKTYGSYVVLAPPGLKGFF